MGRRRGEGREVMFRRSRGKMEEIGEKGVDVRKGEMEEAPVFMTRFSAIRPP